MKSGPESVAATKPHAIMQITMDDDRRWLGEFIVVEAVESWGIVGRIHGFGVTRLTWNHIEPTGGVAVIDSAGKPIEVASPVGKHHP